MAIKKIKVGNTTYDIQDANAYVKPSGGIPKTDLETTVQERLVWEIGTNQYHGARQAEGTASGGYAISEAYGEATGDWSHAEGNATVASGNGSHAEGGLYFEDDDIDMAGGTASGSASHAEGVETTASGISSHAEGVGTTASGSGSHAEGGYIIMGQESTGGGNASGNGSHAEGINTIAQNQGEHAEGKYNKSNKKTNGTATQNAAGSTLHSVGIGTGDNDRKNAFEIMQNGDVYMKGVGGYDGTNANTGAVSATSRINDAYSIASYIDLLVSNHLYFGTCHCSSVLTPDMTQSQIDDAISQYDGGFPDSTFSFSLETDDGDFDGFYYRISPSVLFQDTVLYNSFRGICTQTFGFPNDEIVGAYISEYNVYDAGTAIKSYSSFRAIFFCYNERVSTYIPILLYRDNV